MTERTATDERKTFRVKRPDTGAAVTVRCTQADFDKTWAIAGYELVEPEANTDVPAKGKSSDKA